MAAMTSRQIAARADAREGLLELEAVEDTMRLRFWGPLTTRSATRLRTVVRQYADLGFTKLLLDLRGVGAIDVAGIAALLDARRRLEAEGDGFMILRASGSVHRALKTSGTVHAFHVSEEPRP